MVIAVICAVGVAGLIAGALLAWTGVLIQSSPRRWLPGRGTTGVPSPERHPRLAAGTVQVLHLGVVVVDGADSVIMCNPAGRTMGLLRGEQLALNELRTLARQARRTGNAQDGDIQLLHGWWPREQAVVSARAVPLPTGSHVALLVEDITEARRVDQVRRDFVANVSHELKTPVGALTLLAETLHDATDDPAAVDRFTERIRHEATRLARLVTELIQLSRLEAADPLPEPRPVQLQHVVTEALDRTKFTAAARDIAVHSEAEPSIWVLGNHEQLVTAVVNLLDNAIAYSPEHSRVTLTLRARPAPDAAKAALAEIVVSDQGIGIAEDDIDRVFERFYRADPARSRATGGTGLGLAIVKHIAANHGGQISVTSQEGRGSTFTLSLPSAAGAEPVANSPAAASTGAVR